MQYVLYNAKPWMFLQYHIEYAYGRYGYTRPCKPSLLWLVDVCCVRMYGYDMRVSNFPSFFFMLLATNGVVAHARTAMCLCERYTGYRFSAEFSRIAYACVWTSVSVCEFGEYNTSGTSQDNCFYSNRLCDQSVIVAADQQNKIRSKSNEERFWEAAIAEQKVKS